ncbi:MAG: DUF2203 domain-containing protein [Planctomycetota bacterium]
MNEQLDRSEAPVRLFTVEEANQMLPLVKSIVRDIVELSRDLIERREQLRLLAGDRSKRTGNLYDEEIAQRESEAEQDLQRLESFVHELMELGVELKDPREGLVDFPTIMDGRPALLCWKLGEEDVRFWHDLHAGFAGRQPLGQPACS